MQYIHINMLVDFINMREKRKYKVLKSEDYGISEELGFKLILPKDIEVKHLEIIDFLESKDGEMIKIVDKEDNVVKGIPKILLWNNELYSTKKEKNVCLCSMDIDNGLLLFEGFDNLPLIISTGDIIRTIEGLQEV